MRLVPWANEVCDEAGISLSELDGIAVVVGPGAFTGLRVGLATAIGWALALEVPVVGVSSLETRQRGAADLVMLDARKGRVYAARYEDGVRVDGPADVAPSVALAWMPTDSPFLVAGEGAVVYRDEVEACGGRLIEDVSDPAVGRLVHLGAASLQRGEGQDARTLQPVYLREPDATPPKRRSIR